VEEKMQAKFFFTPFGMKQKQQNYLNLLAEFYPDDLS